MTDSALFKLGRAKRRIDDLSKSLAASSPFRYVLTSNWATGMRYLHTIGDTDEVAEMSLTIGEVLQALGSALDHAYWEIVSPTARDAKEQKRIQFPFGATAERLEEQFKAKLATRVGAEFVEALRALKPFAGEDGNRDLYMLHEFNNIDKHRELTPVGDTKIVDADALKKMHHDFPAWLGGTYRTMFNRTDGHWRFGPALGAAGRIEHTDLGVKVDPLLRIGQYQYMPPTVFLDNLHRATKNAIEKMRAAA